MVTHLSAVKANGCLTLLILPFTLTALTFGSCLVLCKCLAITKMGGAVNFNFFHKGDNRIPYMNASIRAHHRHDPAMKAVRVNGHINKVKQP